MERFIRTRDKTQRARELRETVSRSEARLWLYLRKAALGASFRRQHPIGPYFADYYCAEFKLVIEVDGPDHDGARDAARDAFMAARGVETVRFSAEEAFAATEHVALTIKDVLRRKRWEMSEAGGVPGSEFPGEDIE